MVDNPIYFALTESGRVIGDTTAAATEAAATAAEGLDSPRPPSPLLARCGEDATNAPISCGRHRAAAAAALGRIPEQLLVTLGPELCRMQ